MKGYIKVGNERNLDDYDDNDEGRGGAKGESHT